MLQQVCQNGTATEARVEAGQGIMTSVHKAAGLETRESGDGQYEAHAGS